MPGLGPLERSALRRPSTLHRAFVPDTLLRNPAENSGKDKDLSQCASSGKGGGLKAKRGTRDMILFENRGLTATGSCDILCTTCVLF